MQIVFAGESLPTAWSHSLFLAGPTVRNGSFAQSWRAAACDVLRAKGFDGVVIVPETRNETPYPEKADQVDWEAESLECSDVILFWIPRDLKTLPAFTTNDEWGAWKQSGRVVIGIPEGAEKVAYQTHWASSRLGLTVTPTLESTIEAALEKLGWVEKTAYQSFVTSHPIDSQIGSPLGTTGPASPPVSPPASPPVSPPVSGRCSSPASIPQNGPNRSPSSLDSSFRAANGEYLETAPLGIVNPPQPPLGVSSYRTGAERKIPLRVWHHPTLQAWLVSQRAAGHVLRDIKMVWHSGTPSGRRSWMVVLHPVLEIAGEARLKGNEMVVLRPDVEAVCASYRAPGASWRETEIVCVREYRSPTRVGAVLELPGGSSPTDASSPNETAAAELGEETGLWLDPVRLRRLGARQVAPTLLGHTMGLWHVALTAEEIAQAKFAGWRGDPVDDGEWVEVLVKSIGELMADPTPDWGVLGAVLQACPPD